MKTYDKQKLNEYAKELFALCLEKGVDFRYNNSTLSIHVEINKKNKYTSFIDKYWYDISDSQDVMPIWELIEKVRAL